MPDYVRLRLDKLIEENKKRNTRLDQLNYTLRGIDRSLEKLVEVLIDLTKEEDVEGDDEV